MADETKKKCGLSDSDQNSIESKLYHSSSSNESHPHHQLQHNFHPHNPNQKHSHQDSLLHPQMAASGGMHAQFHSNMTVSQNPTGRASTVSSRSHKFGRRLTQAFSGLHAATSSIANNQRHSGTSISHGKNQKATKTLGVIMGCFILCWLPFFILAILRPIPLRSGKEIGYYIPRWLDVLLLWLGYFNSALNPMIYARYNREFRRPFLEILCFRYRKFFSVQWFIDIFIE